MLEIFQDLGINIHFDIDVNLITILVYIGNRVT